MRRLIGLFTVGVGLVMILGGCATTGASAPRDPLAVIAQFTADDLRAALDDAKAHNDLTAMDCYIVLLAYVDQAPRLPSVKGVVSAFQVARDVTRLAGPNPIADDINRGCAPLFVDTQMTLIRLGILAAPK